MWEVKASVQQAVQGLVYCAEFTEEELWQAFQRGGLLFTRQFVAMHLMTTRHLSIEEAALQTGLSVELLQQFLLWHHVTMPEGE